MQMTKEQVLDWLKALAAEYKAQKEYLTGLDAAIGDADHGINMDRGFGKVLEKLPSMEAKDIGAILKDTGMTLLSSVGGASGPLYGTFFMKAGMALAGAETLDEAAMQKLLESGVEGIVSRGRPVEGDKTMYDIWKPALDAYTQAVQAGAALDAALDAAVAAAEKGLEATVPMQARKGRASYLGERSIGHKDPGGASSCMMLGALRQSIGG
ncbi:dihydroxyacetone kinase, L subunit [Oleidesulfovibrio alaskensis G20]|jgi:dihydroxyacetone kinase-like protein|uniref:Dihydroxyacetone kinase, L subunit n=1 Tax=Oleidesulfovibrio alaskensis (strain ATCC BAA-1058 / DSM 17464 / G20) TaxID=207559 RepID=Q313B6_OLEA2|nr:dihydroxyacetone kinase subunit DhaL [Oleidesulfovibrio alaskensis]ABB37980.1 dihydroxyacetone kinase, L subunit [Oleidesulfovibrio alaskensis G20]MBG0772876.1 dihydroxyacetone kinase subunit L [Oleidesulfovibrio alaskensis]MBL3582568.1 dihydroxyacetone kinase subunit L [Oleidesulfovibrio alaskensis]